MATLHDTVRAALGPLVGARYYPNKFPQETGAPTWPAIRGTIISRENFATLCDAGEFATDDTRLQLDLCAMTYDAVAALLVAVDAAMALLDPPWIRQQGGFETWDAEAKVHRISCDWVHYPSSENMP